MALFRRSEPDVSVGETRRDSQVDRIFRSPGGNGDAVSPTDQADHIDQVDRTDHAQASGDGGASSRAEILVDRQSQERDRRRERRLVDAACRGQQSAIEALYRTHYDTIYRYVLLRIGSPSAAEDVTSQVFLGMIRGLDRYRDEGKPFLAWLYAMARKQVAFFQRGMSRAPAQVDLEAADQLIAQTAGPHATAEERETRVALANALTKLPEGQREVILLRYVLSMSLADTAAAVGRTEGAVKQLQLRGLETLRKVLGRENVRLD